MRDKQSRMQNIIPISFVFCLGAIFGSQIGETNNKHWQLYLSTIHAAITLEHFSCIFYLNPNQNVCFFFISNNCIRQQPKKAELLKFWRKICWKLLILPKYWITFSFSFLECFVKCFLHVLLTWSYVKGKYFIFLFKKILKLFSEHSILIYFPIGILISIHFKAIGTNFNH